MRIIIDAMGGDNAPEAIVKGALRARQELGVDLLLVGKIEEIERLVPNAEPGIEIIDAREIITMDDDPSTATRKKKDSSMTVALTMLRDGKGDAMVSAGSTGALLTGATLIVKRINGIRRAALAPVVPNGNRGVLLIDCGANVECLPEYLLQFGFMGSFYAEKIMGCERPRVALLSNGAEAGKGGELQKLSFQLLALASAEGRINFIGNREASEMFGGEIDVLVTDGFSGNVLLKGLEGTAKFMIGLLKEIFSSSFKNRLAALTIKNDIMGLKSLLDANRIGGTALVGIAKPVIKAHGSSNDEAIFNAIGQAVTYFESGIIEETEKNIEYMKLPATETQKTED